MKNIIEQAKKIEINSCYNIESEDIEEIYKSSNDIFDMIHNSFCFGYMQGMQSIKAEKEKPELAIEDAQNSYCEAYRQRTIDALRKIRNERRLCKIYSFSKRMLEFDQE